MIRLSQVELIYNKGTAAEVVALHNINIEIVAGEFVVILGTNGSGKSTLFNVMCGDALPSKGNVWLLGNNVTRTPVHKRTKEVARIFQNPRQGSVGELSVLENFRLAAMRGANFRSPIFGITPSFRQLVLHTIEQSGLPLASKIDVPMNALSGGQRQALTLLMATISPCKLLLMDEPTASLDPLSAAQVVQLTQQLVTTNNITVAYITHSMREAAQLGNRLIIMKGGEVVVDARHSAKAEWTAARLHEWFDNATALP